MVLPSKSPRSLRSSLRSPFASPKRNEQEDTSRKPVVTKPLAPLSPFRLTPRARRKPVVTTIPMAPLSPIRLTPRKAVRRLAFSIPYDPENASTTTSVTCRSENSEDSMEFGVDAQGIVEEPLLSKAGKSQESTLVHCPTSLPSTRRVSLREFLEKRDREPGPKRATRVRVISRSKGSSTGTITRLGPAGLAGLPLVADLDISAAETLFNELMKRKTPTKKSKMKTRRESGPVFAQLRFSEGEAYVEYVRPDGLSETFSPVSKVTRKNGFVGFHKGLLGSAA